MEGKLLYPFRKRCSKIQSCCHKNINRILALMVKLPKHSKHLEQYAKLCLVHEKLCEYLCNCCCNSDKVSKFILLEYKEKCSEMSKLCKNLIGVLSAKDAKYIRCSELNSLCVSSISSKKTNKK